MNLTAEADTASAKNPNSEKRKMVLLEDVTMRYPGSKYEVLKDANLEIKEGEFVFLVGLSGAGKSTVIKLLTGEVRASSGKIMVNDFDMRTIKRRNLPKLRRTLGVIFQDFRLIGDMTVYENVAFAMRVIGAPNRQIRKRVPEVLKLVELQDCADRLPRELSGGEQQRVAVARAIVNAPDLIIADEPTGNLDPGMTLEIMLLLKQINDMGTTVLVVSHEKELVNAFEKRVVTISNGKLIETDGGYFK